MGGTGMYLVHNVQLTMLIGNTNLVQKCSSCVYSGSEDTFPLLKNGITYTKAYLRFTTNKASKQVAKGKEKENIEPSGMQDKAFTSITKSRLQLLILSLEDYLKLCQLVKILPLS